MGSVPNHGRVDVRVVAHYIMGGLSSAQSQCFGQTLPRLFGVVLDPRFFFDWKGARLDLSSGNGYDSSRDG